MSNSLIIKVYGAEQKCASCVHLPSAKETAEWLEAAISRKFPTTLFQVLYIDMERPENEADQAFSERIIEEDLFYPVVVIDGKVVAEGNPNLKTIYSIIEQNGYGAVS
ncbi:YuzD family protein [Fictibacillus barbaricus]|uniref:YuzD family protein n=1 Tax=Fictibacillus barbaricus TaxID=182136 RepID=A0ABS2ZI55_9BACL|nr:YuzD family protein [Fictibacillus barbaricus]MBN3547097.1 YuzD family protein [Fictibacillus barbaricus]GGB46413.1 putative disulfide oxidoreductase YuzD [Fictibacillus barbaricus]